MKDFGGLGELTGQNKWFEDHFGLVKDVLQTKQLII